GTPIVTTIGGSDRGSNADGEPVPSTVNALPPPEFEPALLGESVACKLMFELYQMAQADGEVEKRVETAIPRCALGSVPTSADDRYEETLDEEQPIRDQRASSTAVAQGVGSGTRCAKPIELPAGTTQAIADELNRFADGIDDKEGAAASP